MPMFAATASVPSKLSFLSHLSSPSEVSSSSSSSYYTSLVPLLNLSKLGRKQSTLAARFSSESSSSSSSAAAAANGVLEASADAYSQVRRFAADWKAARAYCDSGSIYEGRIEGFNRGEPQKSIHDIAKGLMGSLVSVKVIQAKEENRQLIFSEKEAVWSKFSDRVNVGDIFSGRVGAVEDYGAFVHLRFPDGLYHLTGLVHVSEVSWDLVQEVRDVLDEGDEVRVKVIDIDRQKSRLTLSIKQLEEDPLLETLDKVIAQGGSLGSDHLGNNSSSAIEPLPGLEVICQELLLEDGIDDIRINRQGFEKRVVSQDLQLWLSNAPPVNQKFTLLARAGRQEMQLTTRLDQEGIKKALQRVLERVP